MFVRAVRAPVDLVYSCPVSDTTTMYDIYSEEMADRMQRAYTLVRENLLRAAQ